MAETSKARERREAEGFFKRYVKAPIIDIGVGRIDTFDGADPLTPDCDTWDKDNGNAEELETIADNSYRTVYSSHLIEHLNKPMNFLRNCYRICKQNGYIIVVAPDRDSYERKTRLPSNWNADHKFFVTLDKNEPPCTFSLLTMIEVAFKDLPYRIVEARTINTCTNMDKPEQHGDGEYSVEVVIQKLKK